MPSNTASDFLRLPIDKNVFAINHIRTSAGLTLAIRHLQVWLQESTTDFLVFMNELLDIAHVIPLLLSHLEQRDLGQLLYHVNKAFPEIHSQDVDDHVLYRLLVHLADFWTTRHLPFEDLAREVEHCASVMRSRSTVLASLLTAQNADTDALPIFFDHSRHVFEEMKVAPPNSVRDVERVSARALKDLRDSLKSYLNITSDGRLRQTVYKTCTESDIKPVSKPQADNYQVSDPNHAALSNKSASLLFDNVAAFGDTPLLGSSRFIKNLKTARSHPKLFRAIIKKLRALSEGHFDESEPITANEGCVPIYASRISKHCMMIYYHFHAGSGMMSTHSNGIHIFGIYATAALNIELWKAVGSGLAAQSENLSGHVTMLRPSSSADHGDEVRKLIVMDQFIEMSQASVQRLLDDQDLGQRHQLSIQEEEVVNYRGSCYVYGRSGTGKTTIILYKILSLEMSWVDHPDFTGEAKPRQIFVTRSHYLAQKVEEEFERLFESRVLEDDTRGEVPKSTLLAPCLPAKFGELSDDHFPLFISYDELCSLLEAEVGICRQSTRNLGYFKRNEPPLSYETFLSQYWCTFPKRLVEDLDPSSVFAEFLGTIEGSEKTLGSPQGYLSINDYLSSSTIFSDSAYLKEQVYQLFRLYLKRKQTLGHYDQAERTHTLIKTFKECSVDFLYVDETQDFLMIDIFLLRSLCAMPNGLLWAGDTAQTIASGSSFTFNELTSMMYRFEEKQIGHGRLYRQCQPAVFKLGTNFRSLWGIVDCGATVLDVFSQYWPNAIDRIPTETGVGNGSLPLCLVKDEANMTDLLLNSSSTEFGAKQCVLVRDDDARKRLRELLHKSALILTLYESKGLEFDDVIVYDFFHDSTYARSEWSVLQAPAVGRDLYPENKRMPVLGIQRELRFLYVAITRAREKLWIIDSSDKALAMQRIWRARNQVTVEESGKIDLSQFASSSTKEDWAKTGHEFFERSRFSHARQAYENAGLHYLASKAEAYQLRETAKLLPAVATHGRTISARALAFKKASDAFLHIAHDGGSQTNIFYREAAECLLEVPDKERAAELYSLAEEYTEAAVIFRELNLFDRAVEEVNLHANNIPPEVAERIRYAASLVYFRNNQVTKGRKLFSPEESCISFVETYGFSRAHILLLKRYKRMVEMISTLLSLGDWSKAFELFMTVRGELSAQDKLKILRFSLKSARQTLVLNILVASTQIRSRHVSEHASALVELVQAIGMTKDLRGIEMLERKMFLGLNSFGGAVNSMSFSPLETARLPDSLAIINLETSLEFSTHPAQLKALDAVADWLRLCLRYVTLLRRALLNGDPLKNLCIQRLLGFEPTSHHTFRILPDGPMHALATKKRVPLDLRTEYGDMFTTRPEIRRNKLVETCIAQAFQLRIFGATDKILRSRWLQPEARTSDKAKLGPRLESESLQARLQVVCRCVLLLDSLRGLRDRSASLESRKRTWLSKVYELLTSPECNPGLIPLNSWIVNCDAELRRAMTVLDIWIREVQAFDGNKRTGTNDEVQDLSFWIRVSIVRCALYRSNGHVGSFPLVNRVHLRAGTGVRLQVSIEGLLQSGDKQSLHAGILLYANIIKRRMIIEAETICLLTEILCMLISFESRDRNRSSLTGVVFPATCLHIAAARCRRPELDRKALDVLLNSAADLMTFLLTGRGFLKEDGHTIGYDAKATVIVRICKALCSIGLNICTEDVTSKILQIVNKLQGYDLAHGPNPYRAFGEARSWSDIKTALSLSDGLVELATSSSAPSSSRNQYVVRPMPTPTLDNGKLFSRFSAVTSAVWRPRPAAQTEQGPRPVVNLTKVVLVHRLNEALSTPMTYSPAHDIAARKIQLCARRIIRRNQPSTVPRTPLAFLLGNHVDRVRAQVAEIDWAQRGGRTERPLCLGALPHVLACLEALHGELKLAKGKACGQLDKAKEEDLETAGDGVRKVDTLVREVRRMQDVLDVGALVRSSDGLIPSLRAHIIRIAELLKNVPEDARPGIAEELDIAGWAVTRASRYRL